MFDPSAYIDEVCTKWSHKFSTLEYEKREAIEALRREVKNHADTSLRVIKTVCQNVELRKRIEGMEQEHRDHLARIERDAARIREQRETIDGLYAEINKPEYRRAREIALDNAILEKKLEHAESTIANLREGRNTLFQANNNQVDAIRKLSDEVNSLKKQIPNPCWINSDSNGGDRDSELRKWKGWARLLREKVLHLRDRLAIARNKIQDLRDERDALKADLTRALNARTVHRPFNSHPGC